MEGPAVSALAPRPFSRGVGFGLAGLVAVTAADAQLGDELTLVASLAVVCLLGALVARLGDTVLVGGLAVVAAALSGIWNEFDLAWAYSLAAVAAAAVMSVLVALLRANAVTTAQRLRLLRDLLALVDEPHATDQLMDRLLDLLVPVFADGAAIEWEGERLGALGATATEDRIERPLQAGGRSWGTLALALGPSRRRYTDADRGFADLVAGRVAVVLQNAGLARAAAEAERRMTAALDTLGEAVTINGPDGRTVYVNQAAVELLKAESVEELTRAEVGEISARFLMLDEAGRPVGIEQLPAFRALGGEPDPPPLLVRNIVRATGEERWLINKVTVLRGPDAAVDRVVNVIEDVSDVKRAERAQRLLADVTRELSDALDTGRMLERVAVLVAERLADWCRIETDVGEAVAPAGAERPDAGPSLSASLVGGGRRLGTLIVTRADPVRRFGADDREILDEIGRRAGIALLNARLYAERAEIARELQQGMLPPRLPEIPGLEVAALYRPAGELTEVGGDFYDAFPTPRGWMLVIGDVAGQGARAAALTGLARFTLRAAGQLTGDPVRAAEQLNRTLRDQAELSLCTAVCVLLRSGPVGLTATTVSMGHPLPALVRGADVVQLGEPGTIAGAFDDAAWAATSIALELGDALVLYTDGVFDTVGRDGRLGQTRLLERLRDCPAGAAAAIEHVDALVRGFQDGPQADDTALVAVAVTDEAAVVADAA